MERTIRTKKGRLKLTKKSAIIVFSGLGCLAVIPLITGWIFQIFGETAGIIIIGISFALITGFLWDYVDHWYGDPPAEECQDHHLKKPRKNKKLSV